MSSTEPSRSILIILEVWLPLLLRGRPPTPQQPSRRQVSSIDNLSSFDAPYGNHLHRPSLPQIETTAVKTKMYDAERTDIPHG